MVTTAAADLLQLSINYLLLSELSEKFLEGNAKRHDIGAICTSIKRYGFRDPLAIDAALNNGKGGVVEGNGRLEALLCLRQQGEVPPAYIKLTESGDWAVPCIVGGNSATEAEGLAYSLDHNSLTMAGGVFTALDISGLYNPAEYLELLERLAQADSLPVTVDGDDLDLLIEMIGNEEPDLEDDEDALADNLDKAAGGEIESRVSLGQIWACGRHRIACGDSTDEGNVRALLNGALIDLIFTDPPYGVSYADKNRSLNAVGRGNSIQTPIENDHLESEECLEDLWKPCFSALFNNAKPGCPYYVCSPQGGELMMMMMALHETGWLLKPQVIWVKNNHVLGRGDYQLKHEPIHYGWKPGGGHYFTESRSEMSVWEFDKPLKSDLHPTMKPVELVEYAIGNSSRSNDVVFDAFLGSGTTLIAAQQMPGNRTVYGMELSPEYCEVILRRYEKLTGETAELVGSL